MMSLWAQAAGWGQPDPFYRTAKTRLAAQFPAARPREITQAYAAARALHEAAYAVGARCRANLFTRAESEAELVGRFSGFSAEVYGFVVSYGLFVSR